MLPITDGSIAAQARYHLWSAAPATVVVSPPGAGKTTLLVQIVEAMHSGRGDLIAVAAPNRAQVAMVANRLADATEPGTVAVIASGRDRAADGKTIIKPRELANNVKFYATVNDALRKGARVIVANTKKWWNYRHDSAIADFDLLVIDEAYQVTFADLQVLAGIAPQLLLVGDPGQIQPIVTINTARWAARKAAPHIPAPVGLTRLHEEDTTVLQLPSTYRCGPETARLLQPLYPFGFTSSRPDSYVLDGHGSPLPEVHVKSVEVTSPYDAAMFSAAAEAAMSFVGAVVSVDGEQRVLGPQDVAILAPHVHQTTAIRARLTDDMHDMTVDTVERSQGSEWAVVVSLDPANGYTHEVPEHNSDPGRLCVALSRASAHTHWIMGTHVMGSLGSTEGVDERGLTVRRSLCGAAERG